MVSIRFETPRLDRVSKEYGPFEFVQLTFNSLRTGPDGDFVGCLDPDQEWWLDDGFVIAEDHLGPWTDVVIYEAKA